LNQLLKRYPKQSRLYSINAGWSAICLEAATELPPSTLHLRHTVHPWTSPLLRILRPRHTVHPWT
jgi:hypothetical protein